MPVAGASFMVASINLAILSRRTPTVTVSKYVDCSVGDDVDVVTAATRPSQLSSSLFHLPSLLLKLGYSLSSSHIESTTDIVPHTIAPALPNELMREVSRVRQLTT